MNETKWTTVDARGGDYTGISLTPAQARTLDEIRSRLPEFDFYGRPDDYEIKKLELSQAEPDPEIIALRTRLGMRAERPSVFVDIITGMKNDAGTMAEIYCRKRRFFKIGPRGGIESSPISRKGFRPVSMFDLLNREHWH